VSEDLIMLLIRVAVIVFPAGFGCFIVGFMYGRGQGYNTGYNAGRRMAEILSPDPTTEYVTRLTSRNKELEI
jgi:hypothetical protein